MIPLVTRKLLATMRVGDSLLVRERESVSNAGASVQSYASRAGIRVQTKSCFIVIPADNRMIKAVLVSRVLKYPEGT